MNWTLEVLGIHVYYGSPGHPAANHVYGRIEFTDSQEAALRRGEVPDGRDWGVEPPTAYAKVRITGSARDVPDERIAPQRGRWDLFYPAARMAILNGSTPPAPLSQVIETMRVLDAARRSSAIGEPVQVKHQTSN